MDAVVTVMLLAGLAAEVGGIILVIPEPPGLRRPAGAGTGRGRTQGVAVNPDRKPEDGRDSAWSSFLTSIRVRAWMERIGLALLFVGLLLIIAASVAIVD